MLNHVNLTQGNLTFYISHESALDCKTHLIEPFEKLQNQGHISKVIFDFSRVNFLGMKETESVCQAIRAVGLLGKKTLLKNVTPRVSLSFTRWTPEIAEEGLISFEKA